MPGTPPSRVIVVDDAEDVRVLLRAALTVRGRFEIVGEAGDGSQAVRLASGVPHDIVVLDLGLPDLAGREVLTRIRAVAPGTKVVVFSGADTAQESWIAEHVEGYAVKASGVRHLISLLEDVAQASVRQAGLAGLVDEQDVRRARDFVAATLDGWQAGVDVDDALIVTSELVTNAITHAATACELRLSMTPDVLRIEALDGGPGTPDLQALSVSGDHGRGLHIVGALSSAWGIDDAAHDAKIVWAEFRRP